MSDSSDPNSNGYKPMMSAERQQQIHAWHNAAYLSDAHDEGTTVTYLGREFAVPSEVHPPQPMGDIFGKAILAEVRPDDRVLDMGTGSGVNAVLAASKSHNVLAVDVNPVAVDCARANADRNHVGDRVQVRASDVFEHVDGTFDLIIFDPLFRWFKPRDLRERGTADENYESLRTFFRDVKTHLTGNGRILLFFGTSGDIDYLKSLINAAHLKLEQLDTQQLVKDGQTVNYFVYRLQ